MMFHQNFCFWGRMAKPRICPKKRLYMTQRIFCSVQFSIVKAILRKITASSVCEIKSVLPSKEYKILLRCFQYIYSSYSSKRMSTRPRSTNFSSECENELNLRNFLGRILFSSGCDSFTIFEFYQSAVNTIRTNTIAKYRHRIQKSKRRR